MTTTKKSIQDRACGLGDIGIFAAMESGLRAAIGAYKLLRSAQDIARESADAMQPTLDKLGITWDDFQKRIISGDFPVHSKD